VLRERNNLDVLVINSPLFREKIEEYDEDSLPPIGLGYIATNLLDNEFTVELLDAVAENIPINTILDIIRQKNPRYVALNIFTTNMSLVREIVESVDIAISFIIGGAVTKHIYPNILQWNTRHPIDIVIGEGDFVVTAIVKHEFLNVIERVDNRRVIEVLADSQYFPHDLDKIRLNRSLFVNEPVIHKAGFSEASIITSRGCVHNCAFCTAARSMNQDIVIRERSVASIKEEVKKMCRLYPNLNSIRILDDLFLKNAESAERAVEIFDSTPVTWRSMAHVLSFRKLSETQLIKLRESGCREVFVGIESGSSRILKIIRKTSHIELIEQTIERLLRIGIAVKGYFILGFETETADDMQMSYDLAKRLKMLSVKHGTTFRTSVFQFRPYHGTKLYYNLISGGKVVANILQNKVLSSKIGRIQFNFTSGNFSEVSNETLDKFINLINKLNQ
jgi:radical SAM superfamily enzyme YgiQ (UPF0313 family)